MSTGTSVHQSIRLWGSVVILGAVTVTSGAVYLACWARGVKRSARLREAQLLQEIERKETSRKDERAGRIKLEKELRALVEKELRGADGFFVRPMGIIQSCFKSCVGTPRQGLLAPSARARLVLAHSVPSEALDGLAGFSHVWITFMFHLNTNARRNAQAHSSSSTSCCDGPKGASDTTDSAVAAASNGRAHRQDRQRRTSGLHYPAKITPPMLKRRVGVLSTRSPHRPNPVGVTLAKLDRVCMSTRMVYLSAVDLVEGTPVLDIKPYVPQYDSLAHGEACVRVPGWIAEGLGVRRTVRVREGVGEMVVELAKDGLLCHYRDEPDVLVKAAVEVLAADVRSPHQQEREGVEYRLRMDGAVVVYTARDGGVLEIVGLERDGGMETAEGDDSESGEGRDREEDPESGDGLLHGSAS